MTELFEKRNVEAYTDSLAAYMPSGRLFSAKDVKDTNFRKLLRGMAGELFHANGLLRDYSTEILPDTTVEFIGEWESAVGIPDSCFTGTGTLNERRRDILIKLAALGTQTAEDFEELAAIFGITVNVLSGKDPLAANAVIGDTDKEKRFTIVVQYTSIVGFNYEFNFPFGLDDNSFLDCVLSRFKPANCRLLFEGV